MPENQIPRRFRLYEYTPAEKAIYEAIVKVEEAGCDVRLTDAVVLLGEAKDCIADFVDGVPRRDPRTRTESDLRLAVKAAWIAAFEDAIKTRCHYCAAGEHVHSFENDPNLYHRSISPCHSTALHNRLAEVKAEA